MDELVLVSAEAAVERATSERIAQVCRDVAQRGATHCDDCGVEIDLARQQAAPFAVRCVHCQTSAERRMRGAW